MPPWSEALTASNSALPGIFTGCTDLAADVLSHPDQRLGQTSAGTISCTETEAPMAVRAPSFLAYKWKESATPSSRKGLQTLPHLKSAGAAEAGHF